MRELCQLPGVDLSLLQASGANPLTRWASAISTSQPKVELVVDEQAPFTDSRRLDRLAVAAKAVGEARRPSASGSAAPRSTSRPRIEKVLGEPLAAWVSPASNREGPPRWLFR